MSTNKTSEESPIRFVKIGEVTSRLGISRSEVFRRIHSVAGFPKPIRMGARSVVYSSKELDAYMCECLARRDCETGPA